jgi:hypothetical protein
MDPITALGLALQYLRANKKFPDWAYVAIALVAGFVTYIAETHGWLQQEWQVVALGAWNKALLLAGGTQFTSSGANILAKASGEHAEVAASLPFLPVTDSK